MRKPVGVSGMKLYVPRPRVRLQDWCEWTDNPWPKVQAVVGSSFRMCSPEESIYTMAASAVLRLIEDYDVDASRVGFLGFGTESSSDNSAGAVVIKGMVDRALRDMGREPLARNCEVPEYKHACLGGSYAIKGALRYLALDGAGRQAIVVCGDIAEYARGSSGEQTQGAGAMALLLEEDPVLYAVDLVGSGSAADYRGPDFRKPHRRHFAAGYAEDVGKVHDFPVFSGRYSTICYVDEVLRAVEDLLGKRGQAARDFYQSIEAVFIHRPFHKMPVNGLAALYCWGLSQTEEHRVELRQLAEDADADYEVVLAEMQARPDLFERVLDGKHAEEVYPESMKMVRYFRKTAKFEQLLAAKMSLGVAKMRGLGNLYTASLPAWIAAGLEDALERGVELDGRDLLAIGYGSGDAADAVPLKVQPGWKQAAAKIGFDASLEQAVDLSREQYEALHDGHRVEGLAQLSSEFVVDRVGEVAEGDFQDIGVEYYRYVG